LLKEKVRDYPQILLETADDLRNCILKYETN
jgi:hypothetical protein